MTSSPKNRGRDQDAATIFANCVADLREALAALGPGHLAAVTELADAVLRSWIQGGKMLVCGNGGSAADSQHIVAEMVGRFQADRPGYAALALTTNTSILTAVSNDYGYGQVFARQVEGLGRPEDVLLVLSTSGNSDNCIEAVAAARRVGMAVFGFLGGDGGRLLPLVDRALVAPGNTTARIQEVHITMGHVLCQLVEQWRTAQSDGNGGGDG